MILVISGSLLSACTLFWSSTSPVTAPESGPLLDGPANAANGERIYFTASSGRGTSITYRSGPNFGGMMMGSYLTCAACHGPQARGGSHRMHMQVMDAPDITYAALAGEADEHDEDGHENENGEYRLEDFHRAVIEGKHPDGESLSRDMPRWQMSEADLADLFEYIKTLSAEQ